MNEFGQISPEKSRLLSPTRLPTVSFPMFSRTSRRKGTRPAKTLGQGQDCGVGRSDPGLAEPAPPKPAFANGVANWVAPAHG